MYSIHFFYIDMLITFANYPGFERFPFNFDCVHWTGFIACIIISLSLPLMYLSMITSRMVNDFHLFDMCFLTPHQCQRKAADTYTLD